MSQLREALETALAAKEAEQGSEPASAAAVERPAPVEADKPAQDTRTAAERARDAQGRFAPTDPYAQKQDKPEQQGQQKQAPKQDAAPQVKGLPKSWKKDYADHWTKLEPTLQDYILQREDEYFKGIGTHKQQAEMAQQFLQAAQPYEATLRSMNVTPIQAFQALLNADYTLRTADPATKANLFASLAKQYGIGLDQVQAPPQLDPQVLALQQEIAGLKQQLGQFGQSAQAQTEMALQSEIETFSQGKPYFELLRPHMSQLLISGTAESLQDAYNKAAERFPELQQHLQAQQHKQDEEQRLRLAAQAAAKAKAQAVQVHGSPANTDTGSTPKGLRAQIENAWDTTGARV